MYQFDAGDTVYLGVTWHAARYFVECTVVANDRQAGVLVVRDRRNERLDTLVWDPREGGFAGDEVVSQQRFEERAQEGFPYPLTADAVDAAVAAGRHPDGLCDYCTAEAEYVADATADEPPARRCGEHVSDLSRDVHDVAPRVVKLGDPDHPFADDPSEGFGYWPGEDRRRSLSRRC